MRVGFFTTAMHKIQRAYGWSDEYVLDLPVRRAAQIKEAIEQEEDFDFWIENKKEDSRFLRIATMIANVAQDSKQREDLNGLARSLANVTSDTNKKKAPGSTYRTKDGKEVPTSELHNYSYDEIDHSLQYKETVQKAANLNAGKDVVGIFGGNF